MIFCRFLSVVHVFITSAKPHRSIPVYPVYCATRLDRYRDKLFSIPKGLAQR